MCETIPDSPFLLFVGARGKPVNEARVMETVSYLPPSIVILRVWESDTVSREIFAGC